MFANPEPLPGLSSPALLHPAFRPPPANYTLGYTEPSRRAGLSTKGYERVPHPGFIRRVFFSFGRENRIVHHGEHRGHGGSQGSDGLGVLGGAPLQRCSFRAGREAGFSRRGKSVTSGAKAQMKSSLSFARLKLACPERSRRVLHPTLKACSTRLQATPNSVRSFYSPAEAESAAGCASKSRSRRSSAC